MAIVGVSTYILGDVNNDKELTLADVVYLINYLYRNGTEPMPLDAGDANCDGEINVSDVIYLINYLYRGGPKPSCE